MIGLGSTNNATPKSDILFHERQRMRIYPEAMVWSNELVQWRIVLWQLPTSSEGGSPWSLAGWSSEACRKGKSHHQMPQPVRSARLSLRLIIPQRENQSLE